MATAGIKKERIPNQKRIVLAKGVAN